MKRVCHISPVHNMADNRIFYRECKSLADAGYTVSWVVQHELNETIDGVEIVALNRPRSILTRWLVTGWQALFKALNTKSDIFHFHDPEFILQALMLRFLGKKVIYDIHEDYVSAISQKFYIPSFIRGSLSKLLGSLESLAASFFEQVIAERYYAQRFPKATPILNYPRVTIQQACQRSETNLLYTGKVHLYRGAKIHARIPSLVPGTHVSFVGRCAPELHQELERENSVYLDRLSFDGVGTNVPFTEILAQYREGDWLAGLAIFPPNEHLDQKELTKFFEYMTHGLPIIASNFPAWRRLVEENECGICVDPGDEQAIVDAVRRLQSDPALWQSMSENGQRVAREKYSWDSQEETLLQLYERLL